MSLFKKAVSTASRLKLFVYGETGTGKTITALSFPNPAVIDTELGTLHYGKHKEFYVLEKKDYKTVNAALDELLKDPGGYKTFVLDSITVLYENIIISQENKLKLKNGDPNYTLQPRDYGAIKPMMKNLIHKMMSLDMNLVVVSRAKIKYLENEFMKKEGIQPDCPNYIPYDFDVVLELHRIDKKGTAIVLKDRTNTLPDKFDYTYEKFVEYMGIEGLEREPLVINQQKNLESLSTRNTDIEFDGNRIKTAGVNAEQLQTIMELVEAPNADIGQNILKTLFYSESFLDLRLDEADSFIEKMKEEISSNTDTKDGV